MKKYIIWAVIAILAILITQKIFPFPGKYEIIAISEKDHTKAIMIDTINGDAWELERDRLGYSKWTYIRDR